MQFSVCTVSPGWFRLFLAVIVVLYHTSKIVFIGHWAVFVFFTLSGYWLHEMYRDKYSKLDRPALTFCVSRFLRIYPVFAATTVLALMVRILIPDLAEHGRPWAWRQWVPLGYSEFPQRLLEPGWSLDIETQFYILFPLVFAAIARPACHWRFVSLLSLLGASAWLFGIVNSLLAYCCFFACGIAISRFEWRPRRNLQAFSVFSVASLVCLLLILPATRGSVLSSGNIMLSGRDATRAVDVLLAVLTVPFLAGNVRVRDTSLSRHAGNFSYPLYLVHWVTLGPYAVWYGMLPMRERFPYFLAYLSVTGVLAFAMYMTIDRPFEQLRRSLARNSATPTALPRHLLVGKRSQ